jgi:protease I
MSFRAWVWYGARSSRVSEKEVEQMSRIAVIITDMFQDVEYERPAEAFRKAGHELTHVGLRAGSLVKGEHGMMVRIDRAVKDVSVGDFDALFIPGGYSPDKLRVDEAAVRFTGEFVASGKPVFAICHAAQLLITARVLEGRRVTGWKSIIQDIRNAGAEYIDEEVVVDGNLVSSRKPEDIPAFVKAALEMLEKSK